MWRLAGKERRALSLEAGHHGADGFVQPSLLRGIVMEKPVPRAFDLGMIDFVESTAFEKEKENRFRPLSLKKSRSNAPPPSLQEW